MDAGPIRTCVGCRSRRPQHVLIRVTRSSDGAVSIGRGLPGRGAYVCAKAECIDEALRTGRLRRVLRSGRLPEELQHELMRKGTHGQAEGS